MSCQRQDHGPSDRCADCLLETMATLRSQLDIVTKQNADNLKMRGEYMKERDVERAVVERLLRQSKTDFVTTEEQLKAIHKKLEHEKIAYEALARSYNQVVGGYDTALLQVNELFLLHAATKMEHGTCEPRGERACTACNAKDDLTTLLEEGLSALDTCENFRKDGQIVSRFCSAFTAKPHTHAETCQFAPKNGVCACWMSDNTGPGGRCRSCGKMPDMKARLAAVDAQKPKCQKVLEGGPLPNVGCGAPIPCPIHDRKETK